jgi:DNA-3-methyladenine glycosylase I
LTHSLEYPDGKHRCAWPGNDDLYVDYHDTEWGVPVYGDDAIFERLCLEGFQAGLSWITILKRREGFRRAFHGFEIAQVAKMTDDDVERLMLDGGIIRNRAKIVSTIKNANICLELEGGISDFVWNLAPSQERRMRPVEGFEWIATNEDSNRLSKQLKQLGFGFVGPTTMYAMMQAVGMLNDHAPNCFRRQELA